MGRRIVVAGVIAAASLFATGAYAGSPYYDANGQMTTSSVGPTSSATGYVAAPDSGAKPATESEAFDHAIGTDGSSVASSDGEAAAPKVAPVYSAAMPKMDADGFESHESGSSFYNHAVGTDGAP